MRNAASRAAACSLCALGEGPGAATTNCPKLGLTTMVSYPLPVLEARSPQQKCQQGHNLSEGTRVGILPASPGSHVSDNPWLPLACGHTPPVSVPVVAWPPSLCVSAQSLAYSPHPPTQCDQLSHSHQQRPHLQRRPLSEVTGVYILGTLFNAAQPWRVGELRTQEGSGLGQGQLCCSEQGHWAPLTQEGPWKDQQSLRGLVRGQSQCGESGGGWGVEWEAGGGGLAHMK